MFIKFVKSEQPVENVKSLVQQERGNMQKLYMLDFKLAAASMCLTTLDIIYDQSSQEMPYYRHKHNAYEVHFVTAGDCNLRIGDENFLLKTGDLCLVAPGLYHSMKSCSRDFDRICLIFEITSLPKETGSGETTAMLNALQSARVFCLPADNMAEILLRMKEAAFKYEQKIGGTTKLKTLTELLIIELAEHIDNHRTQSPAVFSTLDKRRVFLIDEFFHGNFQINDGDALLAEMLCVSSRQLDRILKKIYGKGFREKLLEVRLEVAQDFLYTTGKSIVEISELIGYACPANFSTFIKNRTGKTPSALRRGKGQAHSIFTAGNLMEIDNNI